MTIRVVCVMRRATKSIHFPGYYTWYYGLVPAASLLPCSVPAADALAHKVAPAALANLMNFYSLHVLYTAGKRIERRAGHGALMRSAENVGGGKNAHHNSEKERR